jgi:hypothetical protein
VVKLGGTSTLNLSISLELMNSARGTKFLIAKTYLGCSGADGVGAEADDDASVANVADADAPALACFRALPFNLFPAGFLAAVDWPPAGADVAARSSSGHPTRCPICASHDATTSVSCLYWRYVLVRLGGRGMVAAYSQTGHNQPFLNGQCER